MLLQGSLKEYPLVDVLAILARRGETGRLDVNLESETAQLYLQDGQPVDCCMGWLKGAEALDEMLTHSEGAFRFSSGAVPPNLLFRNGWEHRDLKRLRLSKACESIVNTDSTQSSPSASETAKPSDSHRTFVATTPSAPNADVRFKGLAVVLVLATMAAVIGIRVGSGISNNQLQPKSAAQTFKSDSFRPPVQDQPQSITRTSSQTNDVTDISGGSRSSTTPIDSHSLSAVHKKESRLSRMPEQPEKTDLIKENESSSKALSIAVVLRIEEGRVVEAYPAQHQPGLEAYEATAVRLARQRRFSTKTGTETLFLTVTGK